MLIEANNLMAPRSQNIRRHPNAIKQTPIVRALLHPQVTRQGASKQSVQHRGFHQLLQFAKRV
jgi:hypothetical protein